MRIENLKLGDKFVTDIAGLDTTFQVVDNNGVLSVLNIDEFSADNSEDILWESYPISDLKHWDIMDYNEYIDMQLEIAYRDEVYERAYREAKIQQGGF